MAEQKLETFADEICDCGSCYDNRYMSNFYSFLSETECSADDIQTAAKQAISHLKKQSVMDGQSKEVALKAIAKDAKKLADLASKTSELRANATRPKIIQHYAKKRAKTTEFQRDEFIRSVISQYGKK